MAKKRERFSAKKRVETKVTGFIDTAIDWGSVEKFEIENADALFLDIMPFVTGVNNPGFDAGAWAYECTYWVHKNFGANPRDGYVCPWRHVILTSQLLSARFASTFQNRDETQTLMKMNSEA